MDTAYENKNGQLKHLFHGKNMILKQLLFDVDVNLTLQFIELHLSDGKATQVINTFSVGSQFSVTLSYEQQQALYLAENTCIIFHRLFYNGVTFHSNYHVKEKALK